MLVRTVYVSKTAPELVAGDIERLIAGARRRNRQLDLTGALLVCDGHFAQALEGQADAVDGMMAKIAHDARHHDLRVQERVAIERRMFADWDMAFVDDSRCYTPVQDLLHGRVSPRQFLHSLQGWVEERREAPL